MENSIYFNNLEKKYGKQTAILLKKYGKSKEREFLFDFKKSDWKFIDKNLKKINLL